MAKTGNYAVNMITAPQTFLLLNIYYNFYY